MTSARPLARLIEFGFVCAMLLAIAVLVPIAGCGDGNGGNTGGKPELNGSTPNPAGGSGGGQPAGMQDPVSGYFGAVFAARDRALMLEAQGHLRYLIQAATQLSMSNQMPKSTGVNFWLALYIGDPAGTANGLPRSAAPLAATECVNLMCCGDPVNHDRMALMSRLRQASDAGLDADSCSWAGPSLATVRGGLKANAIIGTSGQRDGQSFFGDGYIIGKGSAAVDFVEYDDGQSLPKWGEGTLTGVESYP